MPKKTLKLIIDGGNDYIVTIKRNQPNLLKIAETLVEDSRAIEESQERESLHGRITNRHIKVYLIPLELVPDWVGAKRLILVTRFGSRWQGKKSRRQLVDFQEQHYYLSSLDYSAAHFQSAIRGHWLIENRLHWVKDVTLNEDNCLHRGGNAPANWSMLRQFLVSLARLNGTSTLPEALRLMANQLEQQSQLLFGLKTKQC